MKRFLPFFFPTYIAAGASFVICAVHTCSHYRSCVRTIQDALTSINPAPTSVDVSIVTQTVTVRHPLALSPSLIKSAIEDAGFDIVTTPVSSDDNAPSLVEGLSRLNPLLGAKWAKHISQCDLCQSERIHEHDSTDSPRLNIGNSSPLSQEKFDSSPAEISPAIDSSQFGGLFHVTLSIGGMTCASCSNTITRSLVELPGVSDVAVNLLGNSATLTVDSQDRVHTVTQTIEDSGYEAEVITVTSAEPPPIPLLRNDQIRYHLTLSVGGMTCASCSNTITSLVSEIPGVSDVVVNLLGKSATATITHEKLAPQVTQVIEDAGYEAEVVSVEKLSPDDRASIAIGPRTIALRVGGMFCP